VQGRHPLLPQTAAAGQILDLLDRAGLPAAVVTNAPPSEMSFSLARLVPARPARAVREESAWPRAGGGAASEYYAVAGGGEPGIGRAQTRRGGKHRLYRPQAPALSSSSTGYIVLKHRLYRPQAPAISSSSTGYIVLKHLLYRPQAPAISSSSTCSIVLKHRLYRPRISRRARRRRLSLYRPPPLPRPTLSAAQACKPRDRRPGCAGDRAWRTGSGPRCRRRSASGPSRTRRPTSRCAAGRRVTRALCVPRAARACTSPSVLRGRDRDCPVGVVIRTATMLRRHFDRRGAG
jgi:hypothetical protein